MVSKIITFFKKLQRALYSYKTLLRTETPLEHAGKEVCVNECTRDKAAVKRVAEAFKQQEQAMQARALKPHDPTCKDPAFCNKDNCFILKPDVIQLRSMVKRPMTKCRLRSACTKKISE